MKWFFRKPVRFTMLIFLLPLAFAAYFCDFHYGAMAGYALTALLTCLPWLLDRTLPAWVLLPAHLFSLILSIYSNSLYGQTDRWVSYCKPLTVPQQMAFQHLIYLLFGFITSRIFPRRKA